MLYLGRCNVTALENDFHLGMSAPGEIVAALGAPTGKGKELLLTADAVPRTIWTYYYEERNGDFTRLQRLILFVFLKEDRYDGYLWFSSFK